jgi:cytidine deaminase
MSTPDLSHSALLSSLLSRGDFRGRISSSEAAQLLREQGCSFEELMFGLLPVAASYAKPLISSFRVGAVAKGVGGSIYLGANLEFSGQSLALTMHAEQSAVCNAWSHDETGIEALAVNAEPCGYCRQFLYEIANAERMEILVPGEEGSTLRQMLPHAFGPFDLGISGALLTPLEHDLQVVSGGSLAHHAAAIAAQRSYAPYTRSFAGVGLLDASGTAFLGSYAENAAFNPSVSPMAAALNQMNLCGVAFGEISEAVLVQTAGAPVDHAASCEAALRSVSKVPLEVVYATAR